MYEDECGVEGKEGKTEVDSVNVDLKEVEQTVLGEQSQLVTYYTPHRSRQR